MSDRKAILIVDDEAILLLAIRQELRLKLGTGFHYETAMNAEQGLESIRRLHGEGTEVVMVISDWLMPGMRGDEFLRRVHAEHPLAKLVMISGHAEIQQLERIAAESGLFAFLKKPYARGGLAEIAQRALQFTAR